MIELERVTVTYGPPGAAASGAARHAGTPALRDVDLRVEEGELCLVVGPTGSGKSTLLGAVAGLVPHFTGGELAGRVVVAGRDTRTHPPRALADVVGVVPQDPAAGFVTDVVEEELAYGMEQLGLPPDVMRTRVEEVLDLLGLADLRRRPLADLSGGQQQRVALGSVLTAHPKVLVLDEPTSALDPPAAEEVLAAVTRLVHDLGVTVLVAEHRLERVVQYADRVVSLTPDGRATSGDPATLLATSAVAPPVVELGRLAGWSPLPLSVRDARRRAAPLRSRLASSGLAASRRPVPVPVPVPVRPVCPGDRSPLLRARRLSVTHGTVRALDRVDLEVRPGEVVAVMGRNGAGKSSLLWAVQGAGPRSGGEVVVDDAGHRRDPARLRADDARRLVGLVPQTPADLLYLDAVDAECSAADGDAHAEAGTTRALLDRLAPGIPGERHPRDLSEGQRLALVLAVQMAAAPALLLLDEPTRGLDYAAKARLRNQLRSHAGGGRAVVLSTHDVEFVALTADRVVVLADGEVVADGPTADVVVASPAFAPQVAKVLQPAPEGPVLLTVDDVRRALEPAS